MGHHRQARLVGRFDHDPNLLPVQGFFREDAEPVQIHQAGNHNFDEIPSGIPHRSDQRPVRLPAVKAPADEAAVMAPLVNGKDRRPVCDAVLRRQRPGPESYPPAVPAVPQVHKAQFPVARQSAANQVLPGAVPMGRNGVFVVNAVQDHMDVAVCVHTIASPHCRINRTPRVPGPQ